MFLSLVSLSKKRSNCSLFCFFVSKLLEVIADFVRMHSVEVGLESTRLHCLISEDRSTRKHIGREASCGAIVKPNFK